MRRFLALSLTVLALHLGVPTTLRAQTHSLLQQLIDLPAPPGLKRKAKQINNQSEKREYPPEFYSRLGLPADNASLEDFYSYWSEQSKRNKKRWNKMYPSIQSLQRIIVICEEQPEAFSDFIEVLPNETKILTFVKRLSKQDANNSSLSYEIEQWLKRYDKESFSEAVETIQDSPNDYDHRSKQLLILSEIDWATAKPLVEKYDSENQNTFGWTLALGIKYKHAITVNEESLAENYRKQLKATVKDKKAEDFTRNIAFKFLTQNDWEGCEEWFLTLFDDETLLSVSEDEDESSKPNLLQPVRDNPERYIPIVGKLINNQNPVIHNAAIRCLLQFDYSNLNKEALKSLLPWLSNPAWADDDKEGSTREDLIENFADSADEIPIMEAVPHLIWIVANDENPKNRSNAAYGLSFYKDSQAVPALRKALEREPNESYRDLIIAGLLGSGGLSNEEMIAAMEAFAAATSSAEGYKRVFEPDREDKTILPVNISIGKYLCEKGSKDEDFGLRFLERIDALEKSKPEIAKTLLNYLPRWNENWTNRAVLTRIEQNKADAEAVLSALARRGELRKKFADEISALINKKGVAHSIGASLLEDKSAMISILEGKDIEAKTTVLACARLLRVELPLSEVSLSLTDSNRLLALAAERYLESEDSPEAQRLVLAQHQNEAYITGARVSFNPLNLETSKWSHSLIQLFESASPNDLSGYADGSHLQKCEDQLRDELLKNGDVKEIYAHFYYSQCSSSMIVRIYQDKATFSYQNNFARRYEREMSSEEVKAVRDLISQSRLETMPSFLEPDTQGYGILSKEFVSLTRKGGRRVFASTTGSATPIDDLSDLLSSFEQNGKFKLHYYLQDKIQNLEVLLADEKLKAKAVWKKGDDLRVLVEQKDESENSKLFWHQLKKDGTLGETISQPLAVPFLRDENEVPELKDFDNDRRAWQTRVENDEIRTIRHGEKRGLLRVSRSNNPLQLAEGIYEEPLVTPNGKWIIASKRDGVRGYDPSYLIRFNLQTGEENRINLEPIYDLTAIAFVPAQNKFLVRRGDYSTINKKYFLLDAESGLTQIVKNEIRPLEQQTLRPLQPTKKPNEFWAAIYDKEKRSTTVRFYNENNLIFKALLEVPEIAFDSMSTL